MIDTALQELIDFIKNVSPVLWEMLIKQVYADIITNVIWTIILVVTTIFMYRFAKKRLAEDSLDMAGVMSMVFAPIMLIVSAVLLTIAIRMLINPYYYAIVNTLHSIAGGE